MTSNRVTVLAGGIHELAIIVDADLGGPDRADAISAMADAHKQK